MDRKIVTILVQAITADGKIARDEYQFPDWTGKEDKRFFKEISLTAGVVIMGMKTFSTIGSALPGRKNIVMTQSPKVSKDPNVVFTNASPEDILQTLEAEGFTKVVLAGGSQINTLFAKKKLIDKVSLTICPVIFGEGISLFAESLEISLFLQETRLLGSFRKNGQILCNYDVIYFA